jgi:hypothetical protein
MGESDQPTPPDISRRRFLIVSGSALAVAAALALPDMLKPDQKPEKKREIPPVPANISFIPDNAPPIFCTPRIDYNDPRFNYFLRELISESGHKLEISCIFTGHSEFEAKLHPGDPVTESTHHQWNAIDILAVDGKPISPNNKRGHAFVEQLLRVPQEDERRPTRIISPWDFTKHDPTKRNTMIDPRGITRHDHHYHIHVEKTDKR